MKIEVNITRNSIGRCKKWIAHYEVQAADFEAKAETCEPRQRGGYRSQAKQKRKDAERWQATLAAQMGWLAINNPALWEELNNETG